jgi:hypothetical protein
LRFRRDVAFHPWELESEMEQLWEDDEEPEFHQIEQAPLELTVDSVKPETEEVPAPS